MSQTLLFSIKLQRRQQKGTLYLEERAFTKTNMPLGDSSLSSSYRREHHEPHDAPFNHSKGWQRNFAQPLDSNALGMIYSQERNLPTGMT